MPPKVAICSSKNRYKITVFFRKKIITQNFRSLTFRNCTYFVVWVYILLTAGRWSWAKTTFWTRKLGPPKPACWWFELDLALMEHIERPNGACFYKMESYKARGITLEVLAAHGVVQTGEMSLFFEKSRVLAQLQRPAVSKLRNQTTK